MTVTAARVTRPRDRTRRIGRLIPLQPSDLRVFRSSRAITRKNLFHLEETAHLLRVPANAKRLLESLQQAQAGERHEHDLVQ